MALVKNRTVVLAKEEAIYGVDSSPGVGHCIRCISDTDPMIEHENEELSLNVFKPTIGNDSILRGATLATSTLKTFLVTDGDAMAGGSTDIETNQLWQAMGFTVAATAESGPGNDDGYITIAPSSLYTNQKSVTLYTYRDGIIKKAVGMRVTNLKIEFIAGMFPVCTWTLKGLYVATVDGAIITPTEDTNLPAMIQSCTVDLDGYAANISDFIINIDNGTEDIKDVSSLGAYKEIFIGKRNVNGSMNPLATIEATNPYHGDWAASTLLDLSIDFNAADKDNGYQFNMPQTYLKSVKGAGDMVYKYDIPFHCAEDQTGGDDDFEIIMGSYS